MIQAIKTEKSTRRKQGYMDSQKYYSNYMTKNIQKI